MLRYFLGQKIKLCCVVVFKTLSLTRACLNLAHTYSINNASKQGGQGKAHFPPFLFEVFLSGSVVEAESQCTIADEQLVFQLKKEECGLWDKLSLEVGKAEKARLRQEAVEGAQQAAQDRSKEKAVRKDQLQKLSVRQQIQLDSDERAYVERLKQSAVTTALKGLQEWKDISEAASRQVATSSSSHHAGVQQKESKFISDVCEDRAEECIPVPLPRRSGTISVNFTARVFPTPSRESQAQEEQEWLKKQAEARRQVGFVEEDLRPEEQDPVWLKDKGDYFFRAGNYLGAVSAYSHAIKLGSKMPELYSNRAAAHLALNNLHKTLQDCSQALELLVPAVSLNALQRAKCHARMGSALCRLGLPAEGLVELNKALSLNPGDHHLQKDITNVQALINSLPSESDTDDQ